MAKGDLISNLGEASLIGGGGGGGECVPRLPLATLCWPWSHSFLSASNNRFLYNRIALSLHVHGVNIS